MMSRETGIVKSLNTASENGSIRSQIRKMGLIFKTRRKVAAVFPEFSMEEDDVLDLDKQFLAQEKNSDEDDNECTWLSSTISSPSSILEDNRLSTKLQISIDQWLSAGLSKLLANSCYSGEEVPSLVAQRKTKTAENIFHENLLLKSFEDESSGSSTTNSDSVSYFSCSSSSPIPDSDRMSFLGSLLDLDGEDSKWISDTELEIDNFPSGFPSPSYKSFQVLLSSSHAKQAADLADSDTDNEPLFWPCDLDWNSEKAWKSFSMSPRKYTTKLRTHQRISGSKSQKMESKKGRGGFMSNSISRTESKLLELKQRSNNKFIKKTSLPLSRLKNSTRNSLKLLPSEMEVEDKKAAAEEI